MSRAFGDHFGCHGGQTNGQASAHGRAMGTCGAGVARAKAAAQRWTATNSQSKRPDWNSFRTQNRNRLGGSSPRDGLRVRDDLLAAIAGMAGRGRVGRHPARFAQPPASRGSNRLVTRRGGQRQRSRCFWGAQTGPNPTDRRKSGSKHHIITDAQGIPLATKLTGANRHDVTQLLALVDAIPPISGKPGRPRRRPDQVLGDRGYDSQPHRDALKKRGIEAVLAKRNTEHGSGLGIYRWVVERTLSWLHQFRRLRVRYERRDDIHEAFMTIGSIIICWRFLNNAFC